MTLNNSRLVWHGGMVKPPRYYHIEDRYIVLLKNGETDICCCRWDGDDSYVFVGEDGQYDRTDIVVWAYSEAQSDTATEAPPQAPRAVSPADVVSEMDRHFAELRRFIDVRMAHQAASKRMAAQVAAAKILAAMQPAEMVVTEDQLSRAERERLRSLHAAPEEPTLRGMMKVDAWYPHPSIPGNGEVILIWTGERTYVGRYWSNGGYYYYAPSLPVYDSWAHVPTEQVKRWASLRTPSKSAPLAEGAD